MESGEWQDWTKAEKPEEEDSEEYDESFPIDPLIKVYDNFCIKVFFRKQQWDPSPAARADDTGRDFRTRFDRYCHALLRACSNLRTVTFDPINPGQKKDKIDSNQNTKYN